MYLYQSFVLDIIETETISSSGFQSQIDMRVDLESKQTSPVKFLPQMDSQTDSFSGPDLTENANITNSDTTDHSELNSAGHEQPKSHESPILKLEPRIIGENMIPVSGDRQINVTNASHSLSADILNQKAITDKYIQSYLSSLGELTTGANPGAFATLQHQQAQLQQDQQKQVQQFTQYLQNVFLQIAMANAATGGNPATGLFQSAGGQMTPASVANGASVANQLWNPYSLLLQNVSFFCQFSVGE